MRCIIPTIYNIFASTSYIHTYMHTYLLPSDRSSRGDDWSVGKLRAGKSLSNTSSNLFQLCRAVFLRYAVYLIQHDDHGVGGDFPDHNAFGGLGLDALVGIDHENDHVDDLGPSDDRADEGCVTGAIHQSKLGSKKRD